MRASPGTRVAVACAMALSCVPTSARAAQSKTYFDYIQRAWAVGTIGVSGPLSYRDGMVLVFPGRINELVHARVGKPQTLMLVWELEEPGETAPIPTDAPLFAAVGVLPPHSFWRDNLPNTPRHEVLGGRRNVFTGDDVEPARAVTKAWVATLDLTGKKRWRAQNTVLVDALLSGVTTLREDAVQRLARQLPLTKILDDEASTRLGTFITSDAPGDERIQLIDAVGRAGVASLTPTLEKLAGGEDAVAVAAMEALDRLEAPRTTARLVELAASSSPSARAYAYAALGARAADDDEAFAAATGVLQGDDPADVRAAAARGLGRNGSVKAIQPLRAALYRSDEVSRAAGAALAAIGGPEAVSVLEAAVVDAGTDGKVAAVLAILEVEGECDGCRSFLREQHEAHEDQAIRDLIGIVLENERKPRR